jgi:hypothetical protein
LIEYDLDQQNQPPLLLKDGWAIETLADARAVILSLPEHQQRRPYWEYSAQLLMNAAQGDKREAIAAGVACNIAARPWGSVRSRSFALAPGTSGAPRCGRQACTKRPSW